MLSICLAVKIAVYCIGVLKLSLTSLINSTGLNDHCERTDGFCFCCLIIHVFALIAGSERFPNNQYWENSQ